MKANVAWSTDENPFLAGKACAKKAVLDLMQTKIAFLFSSVKYDNDKLLEGIKRELGTAPIIGCTSSGGIIVPDGYITSENGFAGILAIGDPDTEVKVVGLSKIFNERETGRKVAEEAIKNMGINKMPSFYFMLATPGKEEEYEKGIQDIIGNIPMFGGSSADDDLSGKWRIFANDKIITDGVAVAFFYTNKEIKNEYNGNYHETINSGVITEVDKDRILKSINGVPAMKQYAEWTGTRIKNLMGNKILEKSVLKPLGVKDANGKIILIKSLLNGNEDYTIDLGNAVYTNTAIIQMQLDIEELINSPQKLLRNLKLKLENEPIAYIMLHNMQRKNILGGKINDIAKLLKKEAGDVPYIMPFTSCEYGKIEHGTNAIASLMISIAAICN